MCMIVIPKDKKKYGHEINDDIFQLKFTTQNDQKISPPIPTFSQALCKTNFFEQTSFLKPTALLTSHHIRELLKHFWNY